MKHGSPKPKCFREVKIALPCSRSRLDSQQSSFSGSTPNLFYDSESIVSRCVANIMRLQASLLAIFRVGYCFLLRQILVRCTFSRKLRSATLH